MLWSIGNENGENVKVSFHFVLAASQFLMLLLAPSVLQNSSTNSNSTAKEVPMTTRATGTFEVKLEPLPTNDSSEGSPVGRMSIDKQIHGNFEGTGEMLTAATSVKGSGAYVAIERVTGSLSGRSGSFVLQHIGTMTRGVPQLSITVVPDSGTGQLAGLTGKFLVIIADGKRSYEFDYSLPETSN
jgi:Protein of unknown function (DUF3224)